MVQLLHPNQEKDSVHNDEIKSTGNCSGSNLQGNSGNIHRRNTNSRLVCLSLDSVFFLDYKLSSVLYGSHALVHLNENQFPLLNFRDPWRNLRFKPHTTHKYLVDYRSGCISLRADEFLKCVLKVLLNWLEWARDIHLLQIFHQATSKCSPQNQIQ